MEKFEKLSKAEMKNVLGGVVQPMYSGGYCTGGSTGAWYYPDGPVDAFTCSDDILTYCSSGSGGCTYYSG